jgi:nucleotide-binding universal stress UspA family protein
MNLLAQNLSPFWVSHLPEVDSMAQLFFPDKQFSLLLGLAEDDLASTTIKVTYALAKERGAQPCVVQVFDPTPYAPPGPIPTMVIFAEALIGPSVSEERREQLKRRIEEICGEPVSWPIEIVFGTPVLCLTSEAERRSSDLIVLGLHTRGKFERLLGADTSIKVMERVDIPVLAVTPSLSGVPKNILVAVDFSQASLRAAKLASQLVSDDGRVTLAYVQPAVTTIPLATTDGDELNPPQEIQAAFDTLTQEIISTRSVAIETTPLEGAPAHALISHAEAISADLIAVGSQRHNFLERLFVGSVTREIVKDGRRSVLMVPPITAS